jgi:hypothetical protein
MQPRAPDISARVTTLIMRHHNGDRTAAASLIGMAPEQLAGLLSGDWMRFSLGDLALVVRTYDVSITWLLTGGERWH